MEQFFGNIMTSGEKQYWMDRAIEMSPYTPEEVVPYLNKINSFNFIQATNLYLAIPKSNNENFSCINFRSGLTEKETINWILRPFQDKHPVTLKLSTRQNLLSYRIEISTDPKKWKKELEDFIAILEKVTPDREEW